MLNETRWSHISSFDAHPASVARARDFVHLHLDGHARSAMSEDLRLIVSELSTNAIVHGAGLLFSVVLEELTGALRVSVYDDGVTVFPPEALTAALVETGRGLAIVAAISAAWGVADDGTGATCVWATVDLLDSELGAVR